jgi:gas vesicle protein
VARIAGKGATVQETMGPLDTNDNGKVDKSEITAFAQSQGLGTKEVLADFQELDVNGDGELDAAEIGGLLAASGESQAHSEAKAASVSESSQPAVSYIPPAVSYMPPQKQQATLDPALPDTALPSLDIAALDAHVQQQAGGLVAKSLAQRAQLLLAHSKADRQRAVEFETQAKGLRANATQLAQSIGAMTQAAASLATNTVAQKSADRVRKLEETMKESLAAAKEHESRARVAMENVQEVWASMKHV